MAERAGTSDEHAVHILHHVVMNGAAVLGRPIWVAGAKREIALTFASKTDEAALRTDRSEGVKRAHLYINTRLWQLRLRHV